MTIQKTVFIYALTCFGLTQPVNAQADAEKIKQRCSEPIVNIVGKHLGISDFLYPRDGLDPSAQTGGVIIAGVCKVWPKDNSKTIAIFSYDAGVDYQKQLIVVLVDTQKARVVATYKGAIQEDAAMTVGDNSFRIDTARYDLAPGVRAFGLDVTTSFSQGCGDGGLGPVRTLFIQDGKEIRPVLENFYISSWRFVQGGSCVGGDIEIVTEDISYSIGVNKTTSNGYANLLITANSSFSNGDKPKRMPFRYELRYDGKQYPTSMFNGAGAELEKWRYTP